MQGYSNEDTISIHIADHCNLSCSWCYQHDIKNKQIINIDHAKKAIDIFQPKNLVFFGGEALMFPHVVKSIMEEYPEINYIVHTNGSFVNTSILDKVKSIALTINAFSKKYFALQHNGSCHAQYEQFLRMLSLYRDKIIITHNILPRNNEPFFSRKAYTYDRPCDWYVYVTKEEDQEYLPEFNYHFPITGVNTKPKLRVLTSGVVTRDMMGITNLSHIDDWKPEYIEKELPVSSKCRVCDYFTQCHACNMFPHFVKYVLDEVSYTPHFCKFTKMFWEQHSFSKFSLSTNQSIEV